MKNALFLMFAACLPCAPTICAGDAVVVTLPASMARFTSDTATIHGCIDSVCIDADLPPASTTLRRSADRQIDFATDTNIVALIPRGGITLGAHHVEFSIARNGIVEFSDTRSIEVVEPVDDSCGAACLTATITY